MLVVLCTLVVVGFVLTRAAAGANRALRLRDATAWYEAGEHTWQAVRPSWRSGRCVARRRSIATTEPTGSPWQQPSLPIDRMMRPGKCCLASAN